MRVGRESGHPVLIAGGGIGGLATALALARRGLASKLYERRPRLSEEGAGIQIGPNGTKILRRLGIADRLSAMAASPDALVVREARSGRTLARLPLGRWIADRHGAPYWTAHRADLHAALLAAASVDPLIEIVTGTAIEAALPARDGLVLDASDGDNFTSPLLVAADGLWSSLRRSVSKDIAPIAVGKSAVRAVLPMARLPQPLRRNEVAIWLAPGAHVVHYPVRGASEAALVAIFDDSSAQAGWGAPCAAEWVLDRSRSFAEPLAGLVATPDSWRRWSLHRLPELPPLSAGHIALLGDAAHPVMPFLAQGAVLALEDAMTLAESLDRDGDIPRALARYAALRRPRAERVAKASVRNGRIYHLGGLFALARNLALAHLPPERLMGSYDWLYGYDTDTP